MLVVRKSIIWKLFIHLFLAALAVSFFGIIAFYFASDFISQNVLLLICVATLLFVAIVMCYLDVARPLKIVLREVQGLLTKGTFKRIFTDRVDEVGILAYFFNKVTEGFGQVSYDIKDRQRMLAELKLAAQLQLDILPSHNPSVPGLQIEARTKPATEIGGDLFNFITVKDKTFIFIGDATGHGTIAGLIMTMVNSLIAVFSDMNMSTYDILVNVNKYLKKWLKRAVYMTMVMLCWDAKENKMTYVGAGHEHIILYHYDSGECQAILSGGIALGMIPDNSKVIKEQELTLNDHDYIVLYSDGITEAKNNNGELYGLERLKAAVSEYAPQYSAEGVNYHIAKDVSTFMGDSEQKDDMSLIVIRRDVDFKADHTDSSTNW